MPKNVRIPVRMTRHQLEMARQNAEEFGFNSIAGFARWSMFQRPLAFEQKINEIHNTIVENGNEKKKNRKYKVNGFLSP